MHPWKTFDYCPNESSLIIFFYLFKVNQNLRSNFTAKYAVSIFAHTPEFFKISKHFLFYLYVLSVCTLMRRLSLLFTV